MKQLLKDIQQRLIDTVPELKYVDEDWGQLNYYEPHHPVQYPAAVINVSGVQWNNMGKHVQQGSVEIAINVADIKLTNSSGKAPATQRQHAFSIFSKLSAIQAALHGWAGSRHYGPLVRTATRRIKRDDGIIHYEVIYECSLTDNAAEITREQQEDVEAKVTTTTF